jgi:YVTN family beta-propeller protein
VTRRQLLAGVAAAAGCGRTRSPVGFRGYAFVANSEGGAVAAIDLTALAVIRHIPLGANPTQVALHPAGAVYAITPSNASIHEIGADKLSVGRRASLPSPATRIEVAPRGDAIWAMCPESRQMLRLRPDTLAVEARVALPGTPVDFAISPGEGATLAVSLGQSGLALARDGAIRVLATGGELGQLMFRKDGRHVLASNIGGSEMAIFDAHQMRLAVRLPLNIRPSHMCMKADGGQLFLTGEGADAVVTVYPYWTEVGNYMLAGQAPGALAVAGDVLFVANPRSGDVSIINLASQRLMGQAPVGRGPCHIAVTPDHQFACVLSRESGDMALLHIPTLTTRRNKKATLLTMIPVGSAPVSAVVRAA